MKFKAFTLLELMIVVAIIGILATIAVPLYQDYIIRARVMEGFTMATKAQMAVAESFIINNKLPENQNATNFLSPAPTPNVSSIAIGKNGQIKITYTKASGDGNIILTPIMHPNGDLTWDCSKGDLQLKYRPTCNSLN